MGSAKVETSEVCIHCGDAVEGEYVVIDESRFNQPRKVAHLDCDRIGGLRPVKVVSAADGYTLPDHTLLRR
jgi:hypothetical protein